MEKKEEGEPSSGASSLRRRAPSEEGEISQQKREVKAAERGREERPRAEKLGREELWLT